MICDTNWCTYCDSAVSPFSDSLYCSEECLKKDALAHHPMLGYDFIDLRSFPRNNNQDGSRDAPFETRRRSTCSMSSQGIPGLISHSACVSANSSLGYSPPTYFNLKPQKNTLDTHRPVQSLFNVA
ncbi:hypothetical protein PHYBLDRAFT_171887 [Phycomyces blakesleeanus NRRL 1555(-)]|uniref:Uncharacterized protein n=2 Tax=Phycomyces blakesleeanus TaxID=4837 RepID=A0A167L8Z6_PHYB8|nr:hypothetical protein PHYBLDRAFT_171887 [Phycomyces blakesleeanus NRRL 1555(-)]OAD69865.1 hypothetical protein PHYBLDRAFT_171887 [Phycomyces blakesleeanus NRRL 1555(-)]|eukprot:XP_018287905.1 hypothetical protein PHYBLDRAFT_171887 [Phycomyces blakesleeanus NRRL 1555(-)]